MALPRDGPGAGPAAQQAKIEAWQARNAEQTAATGRALPGPQPVPPGQFVRVREAEVKLAPAAAQAAAAARRAQGKGPRRARPGP